MKKVLAAALIMIISMTVTVSAEGSIMLGEIIGAENGYNDNPDVGRAAAFDGDISTYYDPGAASDKEHYTGMKMPAAYILTEIRICPRAGQLSRFNGAAIWGFNGDIFDPNTAVLIWKSEAEAEEYEFQVIKASQFIPGANTGFTSFAYFNEINHGDVAEIELYGNPADGAAAPAVILREDSEDDVPVFVTAAPSTGNTRIIIALASLIAAVFLRLSLSSVKKYIKY